MARALPGTQENLAIFPLGLVALPTAEVPLQIFEARYRVLFSTLLAGSEGIDEGLVTEDKPWLGSRRFGINFMDSNSRGIAGVGTVLEIDKHTCVDDGRILISGIGKERYKIIDVIEERPVLVCKVEYLAEDHDDSTEAFDLKDEVARLFIDTVRLSGKLRDITIEDTNTEERMKEMTPRELSFWVASLFAGNAMQQQALLEENSTLGRLKVEEDLLSNTLKYMSAQAALQSAFSTGAPQEEGSDSKPPTGGPD